MGIDEVQNLSPLLPDALRYFLGSSGVFSKKSHSQGFSLGHQGRSLALFSLQPSGPKKAVVMNFKVPPTPIHVWAELHVGTQGSPFGEYLTKSYL